MPSGLSICVSSQAWSLLSTPLVLSTLGAQSSPPAPQSKAPVPCMKLGEVDRPMGRVSQAFCVCVSFYLCDPEDSQKVLKLNRFFQKKRRKSLSSLLPLHNLLIQNVPSGNNSRIRAKTRLQSTLASILPPEKGKQDQNAKDRQPITPTTPVGAQT